MEQTTMIRYKIIRSKRKTMAIQITKEGEVLVRVPQNVSDEIAHQFIKDHNQWIHKNLVQMETRSTQYTPIIWKEGVVLKIQGKEFILKIIPDLYTDQITVMEKGQTLVITLKEPSQEVVRAAVIEWLRQKAKTVIAARVAVWSKVMQVSYGKITIRNQTTRWGSCSSAGNLNFNWRLLLLPEELMDYVVVHELAHRKEMNHSYKFWNQVEQVIPDYQERRGKLRENENEIFKRY